MRVALFSRIPELVTRLDGLLQTLGHECVGVVTTEGPRGRYGDVPLSNLIDRRPQRVDVLVASGPARFAKLLAALDPDLALCGGFPVRIPADALAVPRLGVVNGHPASLPRYRGPNPIGWALRNGDAELGFSFHRMDADFDTGPILAQGSVPLGGAERAEDVLRRCSTSGRRSCRRRSSAWKPVMPVIRRVRTGRATQASSSRSSPRSTGRVRPRKCTGRFEPGGSPPHGTGSGGRWPSSAASVSTFVERGSTTPKAARASTVATERSGCSRRSRPGRPGLARSLI